MSLYRVTKKFRAGNAWLKNGDIVDATGWRNEKALVENRYLEPTDEVQPTVAVNDPPAESKNSQGPDWKLKASKALARRPRAWAR